MTDCKAVIITVVNQKGGCGKTSTTVNLSHALSIKGNKVLVIDADRQANSSETLGKTPPYELTQDETIIKLLRDRTANINALIQPVIMGDKNVDNLFLISSHPTLQKVYEEKISTVHREKIFSKHLKKLDNSFDFVIIDCPPDVGLGTINSILVSDFILVPIDGSTYSADGIADLLDLIEEIKDGENAPMGIFRNEYGKGNKIINAHLENEMKHVSEYLLKTKISKDQQVANAEIEKVSVLHKSKGSIAAANYKALANELINHPAITGKAQ